MNRLIIVGAGGHSKVVADIAYKNGYTNICFVDDNSDYHALGYPVIGLCSELNKFDAGETDFIIGIGNNKIRESIADKFDVNWVYLVHPSAQIGLNVSIGKGTVVMAGAIINSCTKIREHCIINSASIVEHDNVIENFVHISPNATLGGTVFVGENTHIGIGATVRNNLYICKNSIVGAGAVVVKNIKEPGTYIGIPARKCI